jgi:hypothetical protein
VGADFLAQKVTLLWPGAPRLSVRRWELPLSVRYVFPIVPARPFVRAGVSMNRVFGVANAARCGSGSFGEEFYCNGNGPRAELRHRSTYGPLVGAGIEFRIKRLRLEPEVRLTRWADRNFGVRDSAVRSPLTEVGFVAGMRF